MQVEGSVDVDVDEEIERRETEDGERMLGFYKRGIAYGNK